MKKVIPEWIKELFKEWGNDEKRIEELEEYYKDKCPIPRNYGIRLVKNIETQTIISTLLRLRKDGKI